ncbi:MAG: hypothetical protein AAFQ82_05650 [Myxococcota bacterium]
MSDLFQAIGFPSAATLIGRLLNQGEGQLRGQDLGVSIHPEADPRASSDYIVRYETCALELHSPSAPSRVLEGTERAVAVNGLTVTLTAAAQEQPTARRLSDALKLVTRCMNP